MDYYFQLLDGAGINTLDNNSSKDVDARLVVHPLKELAFGGSYYDGYDRFTSNLTKDQKRTRWGADLAFTEENYSLKGEYIKGQEGVGVANKNTGNPGITNHDGWFAQAGYFFIPRHLEGLFRYDWYDPNTAKTQVKGTYYDFGLTYFFNVWTKLQLYYSLRDQQGATANNNLFEAQLQLAF